MTPVHICMLVALILGITSVGTGILLSHDKAEEFCTVFTVICGFGFILAIGALIALLVMGVGMI